MSGLVFRVSSSFCAGKLVQEDLRPTLDLPYHSPFFDFHDLLWNPMAAQINRTPRENSEVHLSMAGHDNLCLIKGGINSGRRLFRSSPEFIFSRQIEWFLGTPRTKKVNQATLINFNSSRKLPSRYYPARITVMIVIAAVDVQIRTPRFLARSTRVNFHGIRAVLF